MIGREEFRAYSEAVAAIADEAARAVEERVLAWLAGNPGATAAQAREAAKAVMAEVAPAYDDAAAALAAEWYDERAEAAHAKLPAAVTETTYSDDMADRVARYQAAKLEAGDIEGFARACGEFAANAAKRTVNATVMANAGRDRAKGVLFARVPTGKETCSFCLMLASRGAVYHTRRTAGEFNHFHRRCDCKVVPGFEDDPMAVLVEGCDPADYYKEWKEAEKASAGRSSRRSGSSKRARKKKDKGSRFSRKRVNGAMVTTESVRRRRRVSYAEPPEGVSLDKAWNDLYDHEKAGVWHVSNMGVRKLSIPTEDGGAAANLGLVIDGKPWEMRNVTNPASSVNNQVKRARAKWCRLGRSDKMRAVITTEGLAGDVESVVAHVAGKLRSGEVAIVIDQNGNGFKVAK